MTKRRARAFFVASTLLSALIFLALTVDSHRKIPALTNAAAIDATVIAGKNVWHRNNCINCHTLLGEGAYYAPDLTQITSQRGRTICASFSRTPARFYSEKRDRRLMPTLALSGRTSPRSSRSSGGSAGSTRRAGRRGPSWSRAARAGGEPRRAAGDGRVQRTRSRSGGRRSTRRRPAASRVTRSPPASRIVGPSLVRHRRHRRRARPRRGLQGRAKDAAAYIRESIVDPNAHVLAGPTFSAPGANRSCPNTYGQTLKPEQVKQIVAYLLTLK